MLRGTATFVSRSCDRGEALAEDPARNFRPLRRAHRSAFRQRPGSKLDRAGARTHLDYDPLLAKLWSGQRPPRALLIFARRWTPRRSGSKPISVFVAIAAAPFFASASDDASLARCLRAGPHRGRRTRPTIRVCRIAGPQRLWDRVPPSDRERPLASHRQPHRRKREGAHARMHARGAGAAFSFAAEIALGARRDGGVAVRRTVAEWQRVPVSAGQGCSRRAYRGPGAAYSRCRGGLMRPLSRSKRLCAGRIRGPATGTITAALCW